MSLRRSRYIKHELFKKKAIKKLPPFLDAWSDSSSPTFIYSVVQKRNFSLPHLRECCWYLECKKNWQPDEEAALKIKLSSGEALEDSPEADDVIHLDSQLPEGDELVGPLDAPDTQKPKRRRRGTQDDSTKKRRNNKAKMVEDSSPPLPIEPLEFTKTMRKNKARVVEDSPPPSPEEPLDSTATHPHVVVVPRPPLMPIISSSSSFHASQDLILNASILQQRRVFHPVSKFILSLPPSRTRRAFGTKIAHIGMADLVIADLPENLPVPTVSDPPSSIPSWNVLDDGFLGELFDFADEIIHDDGALLLFHPQDDGDFRELIESHFPSFGFAVFKEWLGVNRLRLRSAKHPNKTTNLFQVLLLVRATKTIGSDADMRPRYSSFQLRDAPELKALGIELNLDDAIMNYTASPLMDGPQAWRGPREKDISFLSSLIMGTTDFGDVVVDVTAGTGMYHFFHLNQSFQRFFIFDIITNDYLATGASVHACKQLGRHIVALEDDKDIFTKVLQPLKDLTQTVKAPQSTQPTQSTQRRQPALKRPRPEPSQ